MLSSSPLARWISDHLGGGKPHQRELSAVRETPALEGGRLQELRGREGEELSSSLPCIPLAVDQSEYMFSPVTRRGSDPDKLSKSPTGRLHNFSHTLMTMNASSATSTNQESSLIRPRAHTVGAEFLGSSAAAKWMMKKRQLAERKSVTSPLTQEEKSTSTEKPPVVNRVSEGGDDEESVTKATTSWWNTPLFGQRSKNKTEGAAVTYSKEVIMSEPDFHWPVADVEK